MISLNKILILFFETQRTTNKN